MSDDETKVRLADLKLSSEASCRGQWWLPSNPSATSGGTLTVPKRGHITLDLNGPTPSFGTDEPIGVIHGRTERGEPITLSRNLDAGTLRYFCRDVFVGPHLSDPDAATFTKLHAQFEHLEEWLHWSPFRTSEAGVSSATIDFEMPSGFRAWVPDLNAYVSAKAGWRRSVSKRTASLGFDPNLEIEPSEPCGLSWFLQALRDLEAVLAIVGGQHLALERIRLSREQTALTLLFDTAPQADSKPVRRMLFGQRDVLRLVPRLAQVWFAEISDLRPVVNLLLGPLAQDSMFVEYQFLSSMQALEGFHRRFYPGGYASPDEYEPWRHELVRAIPGAVPSDLRQALKSRLKYGYEYSQRRRLKLLLDMRSESTFAALTDGFSDFIASIVDTRNHLVHNLVEPGGRTLSFNGMLIASDRLRVWLLVVLLTHLGFPEAEVVERIRRHPDWRSRLQRSESDLY